MYVKFRKVRQWHKQSAKKTLRKTNNKSKYYKMSYKHKSWQQHEDIRHKRSANICTVVKEYATVNMLLLLIIFV